MAWGQDVVVPIAGVRPHVVVSLTNEHDAVGFNFFASSTDYNDTTNPRKSTPISVLPVNGGPHYEVFTYDTGSPFHILSHQATTAFGIPQSGRAGTHDSLVTGVDGTERKTLISDPLGVYATGFDSITAGSPLQVDTNRLRGQYNVSVLNGVLAGTSLEDLPNTLGTPLSSQYTTVIKNSAAQLVEINGELRRSPGVDLFEFGSLSPPSRRMALHFEGLDDRAFPPAAFFPSADGLLSGDNPTEATNSGWFFVNSTLENEGLRTNLLEMQLDTGAQASVISEHTAALLGFDLQQNVPDFWVRIQGVTGVTENAPGFMVDKFVMPGTDGGLVLTDVPFIVHDITDPRDGSTLPGLLGMNVFADRDLIIHPEPGQAYLGVTDSVVDQNVWAATRSPAAWSNPANWQLPESPTIDHHAHLTNHSEAPLAVMLTNNTTVRSLTTEGNDDYAAGTTTLILNEGVTLTLYGSAIIETASRIHLDNARVDALAIELRGGEISGSGTISGETLGQGRLRPGGTDEVGILRFADSLVQLPQGTVDIELRDSRAFDQVIVDGAITLDGALAISTTSDATPPARGTGRRYQIMEADGGVFDAFTQYTFQGEPIGEDCDLDGSTGCQQLSLTEFRHHVGDGQFIQIDYSPRGVAIIESRALQGDTDGDGSVGFDDFVRVAGAFGGQGDWQSGDFTGDGAVTFADFITLSQNYSDNPPAITVPEATSVGGILVGLAMVAGLIRRPRRR